MENPNAPAADPSLSITHYLRNKEQDHLVGIYEEELKEIAEEDEEGHYFQNNAICSFYIYYFHLIF